MPKRSIIFGSIIVFLPSFTPDVCNAVEYGITTGYSRSYFGGEDRGDFGGRNSFTAGLYSVLPLTSHFSFEAGLRYMRLGADGPGELLFENDLGFFSAELDANHRLDYVTAPLKLRVKLPFKIRSIVPSVALGIVPAINLSAKTEFIPSNQFPATVFEAFNVPITHDIRNNKITELWFVVSPAFEMTMLGRAIRIEGEWIFGLRSSFGELECIPPSDSNTRRACELFYGLFDYGLFETTPLELKNRSLMLTLSLSL